eukprot:455522_1
MSERYWTDASNFVLKICDMILNRLEHVDKINIELAVIHRLNNYEIVLDQLYNAGFKRLTDDKHLLWEKTEKNIEMLKKLKLFVINEGKVETTTNQDSKYYYDEHTVQEIVKEGFTIAEAEFIIAASHHEYKTIQLEHECICGNNLKKRFDGSVLYGGKGCKCDQCGLLAYKNDGMWHCEKKDDIHVGGFDICDNCIYTFDAESWLNAQVKKTEEMKDTINEQSKGNVGYLIDTEDMSQCIVHNKCELSKCVCLKNIIKILNKYKSYVTASNSNQQDASIDKDVYETISNKYNPVTLLNDFNHLLQFHPHVFEDIYDMMNNLIYNNAGCILGDCLLMRRHHRDRSKIYENETILNDLYFMKDDVVSQQLLDRVHCHYFHSFDSGHKLSKKDKQDIANQEKKSNDEYHHIISSKILSKSKSMNELYRMKYKKHKFNHLTLYNFGVRFYYWPKYKNCSAREDPAQSPIASRYANVLKDNAVIGNWYVGPKYGNLKSELVNNDICRVSSVQWQNTLIKAEKYYESDVMKNMRCQLRQIESVWYELNYRDVLKRHHLVVLLTYCNYDLLSFKFSETYRPVKEKETDSELKERHSNYYWMGRLLRECVECFGMQATKDHVLKVYHGVNEQFLFTSMYDFINGPLSTTRSYAVAVEFCAGKGMILDLSIVNYGMRIDGSALLNTPTIPCFDMSFISDYSDEAEIFHIGGSRPFIFNTIIEPTGINYQMYMKALNGIMHGIIHEKPVLASVDTVQFTRDETQMMFRILSHRAWEHNPSYKKAYQFKGCPDYFKTIMDLHFKNVKEVCVAEEEHKVMDYFLRDGKGWLNMDLLSALFPNVESIQYVAVKKDISFFTDDLIYKSILSLIESGKMKHLKLFVISIHPKLCYDIGKYVKKHEKQFFKNEWKIITKMRQADLGWAGSVLQRIATLDPTALQAYKNRMEGLTGGIFDESSKDSKVAYAFMIIQYTGA